MHFANSFAQAVKWRRFHDHRRSATDMLCFPGLFSREVVPLHGFKRIKQKSLPEHVSGVSFSEPSCEVQGRKLEKKVKLVTWISNVDQANGKIIEHINPTKGKIHCFQTNFCAGQTSYTNTNKDKLKL